MEPGEVVTIFSPDRASRYADIVDAADDWTRQYLIAKEQGIAPQTLSAPLFLLWEITARCPQQCVYCYNSSPRRVQELSPRRLFQIADQIIEAKVFNMCVSGGEPTMRSEYLDLIQYLVVSGVSVGTVVSGWKVDREKAARIARWVGTVQVSLDGSRAEIHDKVRQRRGSWEDAVTAIRHFVDLGCAVNVSFAVTKENIHDFPAVHELCANLGVTTLRTQKLCISGKAKADSSSVVTDQDYQWLKEQIATLRPTSKMEIAYGDPSTHISFGRSLGIVALGRITAEGNMGISPYLDIFFGNLATEDFKTVWNRMRNGWRHPVVEELVDRYVSTDDEVVRDAMPSSVFLTEEVRV